MPELRIQLRLQRRVPEPFALSYTTVLFGNRLATEFLQISVKKILFLRSNMFIKKLLFSSFLFVKLPFPIIIIIIIIIRRRRRRRGRRKEGRRIDKECSLASRSQRKNKLQLPWLSAFLIIIIIIITIITIIIIIIITIE